MCPPYLLLIVLIARCFKGTVEYVHNAKNGLAPARGRVRTPLIRLAIALRYPDFRVLWLSTVSNQLGWGMQQVL